MLMVTLFWGILAVIKSSQIPTEFSNRISIKNVVPIDSKSVNISWIYDDESLTSDIPTLTTIKINSDNNNNNKSSLPVQYFKLQTRNFSDVNSDWLDLVSVKPEYRFTIVDKLIPTKDYAFRLAAFSPHSDQLITSSNGPTSSSLSLANHTSDTINDQLVNNAKQSSQWSYANITMPAESPPSITSLKLLRRTNKTIWIGWTKPSHDSGADISEYQLELQHRNGTRLYNETLSMNRETSGSKNLMFMFVGLEPAENYTIQVRACTSNVCGKWSDPQLRVSTLDGVSGPPNNVSIACLYDANKSVETISISWDAPLNPKGTIIGYTVSLVGSALFRNQDNQIESDSFKKAYHMDKNQTNLVLSDTKPNTNYSVQICTINESGCGELSELSSSTKCSTRPTLPNDLPSHLQLTLFNYNDPFCRRLKLKIPRISERNGPIKCYKVVIIKLPKNADYEQVLPVNSSDVNITSYDSVHLSSSSINQRQENNLTIGAYIAEEVSPEDLDHEIVIGDDDYTTCEDSRTPRRIGVSLSDESQSSALSSSLSYTPLYTATKLLEDGPLDFLTNYTGFLEVKVSGPDNTSLIKRTNYFTPVQSGALDPSFKEHSSNFAPILSSFSEPAAAVLFGIVCGLTLVLFSILSVICFLRKQVDEYSDSGEEEVRLGLTSLFRRAANGKSRQVLTNGGILSNGHKWIGQPISIHNLPNIFIERHADGDALFQQEFKALPETFHNRTSHDSSLPENILKNRYPDIKCYDQTRVKLKPIDGVQGSDYINANFVEGYKSRKVYICAQGPTERTVSDFWRMIDEHKVSVIVMLTGIEENGKVKCAQYWNESGTKEIDNLFKVTLRSCVKYSDFLMRRFDLRQLSSSEEDEYPRDILHFHFLLWKDFLAPEQPSWILRFIKRVNEHFSPDRGPILVHCSAGVGRTGTFIAIDSLIPEITSAKTVNIFECVSQLRYQRNFLVQSFKQYIFIYRALMEFAQFGDTEIEICHLKEYYRQMKEQKFEGNINGVVAEFDVSLVRFFVLFLIKFMSLSIILFDKRLENFSVTIRQNVLSFSYFSPLIISIIIN